MRLLRPWREASGVHSPQRRIEGGAHQDRTGAVKILYSHRTRSADGQYVHIRELTEALAARGCEIVMAGPDEGAAKPLDAGGPAGLKRFLPKPFYECAEYGYSYLGYRRLAALAAEAQPDVLYERYNLFYQAGAWLRRRTGLPMLLEVNAPLSEERSAHGGLAFKGFARRAEAAVWRAADMVLPVSGVLADYVRAAGVPDDRIMVVHNGVGADFLVERDGWAVRKRYGLEDKLVLGFTGFVRDWHRVDRAIRFLARHENKHLAFLLVGDGPVRPALEALAGELGVADRVRFAGVVQREALADHVAAFDIALQPAATAYASPLKLFEYMALGKAILAPASPNIAEAIADGEEAVLFPQGEGGFDKALSVLVEDAGLRDRLGNAARARLIRDDRTWSGNARRIERLAETLLENPHVDQA